jgi:signal transduction histidine kinase
VDPEYRWRFEAAVAPHRLVASVRGRSAVAAVLVVALALAAGAALLYYVLQRQLLHGLDTAATVRAGEVATRLVAGGEGGLDAALKAGAREGQLVQVVDPAGRVVASSSGRPDQEPITGLTPAPGQVLREEAGLFKIVDDTRPFLALSRGVSFHDRPWRVVVASFTEGQRASVITVLKLLLIGFPGLLVMVAAAVWLLIGRALRPVEQIRLRVAGIGVTDERDGPRPGGLDERVPIPPTRDEIARLAITMNQMLDRLQAAQQAQRQFVADASHELRSPLATLSASLEVAGADVSGRAWRDLRAVMAAEADRMATLVENLLLLARADDQGLRIATGDVDLDDLMELEARRLRTASTLLVSTAIEPVRVVGDRQRLSQMLRNLVDNAGRHARGQVRLTLARAGDDAVLTVDDDGPGIEPAQRQRVFGRFVRLDESRDRARGGAGLGLAIVREVVLGHRGAVVVAQSPEGGCRVVVRLPLTPAASTRAQNAVQPPVADRR